MVIFSVYHVLQIIRQFLKKFGGQMYEEVPEKHLEPKGFWNSIIGKIIRWISYIPIALIVLLIIEILSYAFFWWLFRDMRGFIVIGILFGALFTLLPIIVAGYFYLLTLSINICPNPKVGSIIFGIIYGFNSISQLINFLT